MPPNERKFLIFEVQDVRFAFDLAQVAEIADPPCSWPIPLAPACFTGAMHVHGSIVAALDLSLFLGLPRHCEAGKMILLHQSIASLAFLVDRILRIVPEQDITIYDSTESRYASSTLLLPEGEIMLLDAHAIVKAAENMMF